MTLRTRGKICKNAISTSVRASYAFVTTGIVHQFAVLYMAIAMRLSVFRMVCQDGYASCSTKLGAASAYCRDTRAKIIMSIPQWDPTMTLWQKILAVLRKLRNFCGRIRKNIIANFLNAKASIRAWVRSLGQFLRIRCMSIVSDFRGLWRQITGQPWRLFRIARRKLLVAKQKLFATMSAKMDQEGGGADELGDFTMVQDVDERAPVKHVNPFAPVDAKLDKYGKFSKSARALKEGGALFADIVLYVPCLVVVFAARAMVHLRALHKTFRKTRAQLCQVAKRHLLVRPRRYLRAQQCATRRRVQRLLAKLVGYPKKPVVKVYRYAKQTTFYKNYVAALKGIFVGLYVDCIDNPMRRSRRAIRDAARRLSALVPNIVAPLVTVLRQRIENPKVPEDGQTEKRQPAEQLEKTSPKLGVIASCDTVATPRGMSTPHAIVTKEWVLAVDFIGPLLPHQTREERKFKTVLRRVRGTCYSKIQQISEFVSFVFHLIHVIKYVKNVITWVRSFLNKSRWRVRSFFRKVRQPELKEGEMQVSAAFIGPLLQGETRRLSLTQRVKARVASVALGAKIQKAKDELITAVSPFRRGAPEIVAVNVPLSDSAPVVDDDASGVDSSIVLCDAVSPPPSPKPEARGRFPGFGLSFFSAQKAVTQTESVPKSQATAVQAPVTDVKSRDSSKSPSETSDLETIESETLERVSDISDGDGEEAMEEAMPFTESVGKSREIARQRKLQAMTKTYTAVIVVCVLSLTITFYREIRYLMNEKRRATAMHRLRKFTELETWNGSEVLVYGPTNRYQGTDYYHLFHSSKNLKMNTLREPEEKCFAEEQEKNKDWDKVHNLQCLNFQAVGPRMICQLCNEDPCNVTDTKLRSRSFLAAPEANCSASGSEAKPRAAKAGKPAKKSNPAKMSTELAGIDESQSCINWNYAREYGFKVPKKQARARKTRTRRPASKTAFSPLLIQKRHAYRETPNLTVVKGRRSGPKNKQVILGLPMRAAWKGIALASSKALALVHNMKDEDLLQMQSKAVERMRRAIVREMWRRQDLKRKIDLHLIGHPLSAKNSHHYKNLLSGNNSSFMQVNSSLKMKSSTSRSKRRMSASLSLMNVKRLNQNAGVPMSATASSIIHRDFCISSEVKSGRPKYAKALQIPPVTGTLSMRSLSTNASAAMAGRAGRSLSVSGVSSYGKSYYHTLNKRYQDYLRVPNTDKLLPAPANDWANGMLLLNKSIPYAATSFKTRDQGQNFRKDGLRTEGMLESYSHLFQYGPIIAANDKTTRVTQQSPMGLMSPAASYGYHVEPLTSSADADMYEPLPLENRRRRQPLGRALNEEPGLYEQAYGPLHRKGTGKGASYMFDVDLYGRVVDARSAQSKKPKGFGKGIISSVPEFKGVPVEKVPMLPSHLERIEQMVAQEPVPNASATNKDMFNLATLQDSIDVHFRSHKTPYQEYLAKRPLTEPIQSENNGNETQPRNVELARRAAEEMREAYNKRQNPMWPASMSPDSWLARVSPKKAQRRVAREPKSQGTKHQKPSGSVARASKSNVTFPEIPQVVIPPKEMAGPVLAYRKNHTSATGSIVRRKHTKAGSDSSESDSSESASKAACKSAAAFSMMDTLLSRGATTEPKPTENRPKQFDKARFDFWEHLFETNRREGRTQIANIVHDSALSSWSLASKTPSLSDNFAPASRHASPSSASTFDMKPPVVVGPQGPPAPPPSPQAHPLSVAGNMLFGQQLSRHLPFAASAAGASLTSGSRHPLSWNVGDGLNAGIWETTHFQTVQATWENLFKTVQEAWESAKDTAICLVGNTCAAIELEFWRAANPKCAALDQGSKSRAAAKAGADAHQCARRELRLSPENRNATSSTTLPRKTPSRKDLNFDQSRNIPRESHDEWLELLEESGLQQSHDRTLDRRPLPENTDSIRRLSAAAQLSAGSFYEYDVRSGATKAEVSEPVVSESHEEFMAYSGSKLFARNITAAKIAYYRVQEGSGASSA
jgi:hypothetical protein